jgi:hypothetical protein
MAQCIEKDRTLVVWYITVFILQEAVGDTYNRNSLSGTVYCSISVTGHRPGYQQYIKP